MLWAILKSIRINQWTKSAFVLAPALFTLEILNPKNFLVLLSGFLGFSLIASAMYIFNDLINAKEDRAHPVKRERPIAKGLLTVPFASVLSLILLSFGLSFIYLGHASAINAAVAYVILVSCYTLILRRLYIVDVIVIALGYVLRIEVGAEMINSPVSKWLLLCTFTIALFLALIKRRQEIIAFQNSPEEAKRFSLSNYPALNIIDGWINVVMSITLISYALYTMDPTTISKHHTVKLMYTVPFVLYGLFRYQKIAFSGRAGEDPTKLITKDFGMIFVVLLWIISVGIILYFAK